MRARAPGGLGLVHHAERLQITPNDANDVIPHKADWDLTVMTKRSPDKSAVRERQDALSSG